MKAALAFAAGAVLGVWASQWWIDGDVDRLMERALGRAALAEVLRDA